MLNCKSNCEKKSNTFSILSSSIPFLVDLFDPDCIFLKINFLHKKQKVWVTTELPSQIKLLVGKHCGSRPLGDCDCNLSDYSTSPRPPVKKTSIFFHRSQPDEKNLFFSNLHCPTCYIFYKPLTSKQYYAHFFNKTSTRIE